MTDVRKMSSKLQTFTNLFPEQPYKNIFTCSVGADFPCLCSYHYPIVPKGKPKRFYHSVCKLEFVFLGGEIVTSIFYTDFIVFDGITEYLCLKENLPQF